MNVSIEFLGGAGTVTGSKHLIRIGFRNVLLDCGLFQGLKELRLQNWEGLPIANHEIDAVVLSHAHLDHSGYLPRLVKHGYKGPIYCTQATADLLKILLMDSAKLQEEDALFAKKKGFSKHKDPLPLYDQEDALAVFPNIEFAEAFQKAGDFDEFKVEVLDLYEFFEWLDDFKQEKIMVAVFPTPNFQSAVMKPEIVREDFEIEFDKEKG